MTTNATTPTMARLPGCRMVNIGDSITIGGELKAAHYPQYDQAVRRSWPGYAAWLSGGKMQHTYNAAMAGERSDQMLARFDADVLARKPSLVTIMAGTNDMSAGRDIELWKADMRAMADKTRLAGAVPVILTLPPRDDADIYRLEVPRRNAWLRSWCASEKLPLVDAWAVLVDPVTAKYRPSMAYDLVHPNESGMRAIAEEFNRVILPLVTPTPPNLVMSVAEAGLMVGNGTFTSVANPPPASTPVGPGSTTVTYENAAPNPGRYAALTIAGDTSPDQSTGPTTGIEYSWTTLFTPGDTIYFGARFISDGNQTTVRVVFDGTGVTSYPLWQCKTPTEGIVEQRYVIPAGTTKIRIALLGANGVHKFGQFTVRNLSALGVAAP